MWGSPTCPGAVRPSRALSWHAEQATCFLFIDVPDDYPLVFGPYPGKGPAVAAFELIDDLGWPSHEDSRGHYVLDVSTLDCDWLDRLPDGTVTINTDPANIADTDRWWLPRDGATMASGRFACWICRGSHRFAPKPAARGRRS